MSKTNNTNDEQPTFENINRHVAAFDVKAFHAMAAIAAPDNWLPRIATAWPAVRLILLGLGLIPGKWSTLVRLFVSTLDEATASFKAGKDV